MAGPRTADQRNRPPERTHHPPQRRHPANAMRVTDLESTSVRVGDTPVTWPPLFEPSRFPPRSTRCGNFTPVSSCGHTDPGTRVRGGSMAQFRASLKCAPVNVDKITGRWWRHRPGMLTVPPRVPEGGGDLIGVAVDSRHGPGWMAEVVIHDSRRGTVGLGARLHRGIPHAGTPRIVPLQTTPSARRSAASDRRGSRGSPYSTARSLSR